jgi:hypothetical protein
VCRAPLAALHGVDRGNVRHTAASRGLRPWLFTAAPPGLTMYGCLIREAHPTAHQGRDVMTRTHIAWNEAAMISVPPESVDESLVFHFFRTLVDSRPARSTIG